MSLDRNSSYATSLSRNSSYATTLSRNSCYAMSFSRTSCYAKPSSRNSSYATSLSLNSSYATSLSQNSSYVGHLVKTVAMQSKEECKDQESIQSSTTPGKAGLVDSIAMQRHLVETAMSRYSVETTTIICNVI